MKTAHMLALAVTGISLLVTIDITLMFLAAEAKTTMQKDKNIAEQASLSVAVTRLKPAVFKNQVFANGSIAAWQEASIGSESAGLRLIEVKVDVGDKVQRGQLLAKFAAETVEAELAHSRAIAAEAAEALVEAAANGQRARLLQKRGTLSAQLIQQYLSAERTAQARLDAAKALERAQQLRLEQTRILAPDDGVISSRTATLGAVVPAGEELFRLIRDGRIEWRAEVAATDLGKLQAGQKVMVTTVAGGRVEGRLRILAPTVDTQTRNGLVYVDLPPSELVRDGMFARGEFNLGSRQVLTLPYSALQVRDGFSYVMRVGANSRVTQSKVTVGHRSGDRVEIIDGLDANDRIVISGAVFLGDGDLVRVVDEAGVARSAPQPVSARIALGASGGEQ